MLVSTKDMLVKAQRDHYAVANFCIWNVEMLSGVMNACEKLQSPVILSFGSGFLVNTDINHFVHMMRSYATQTSLPCSIHWDHGRSFEIVSHAIDIGYNSLMIDGSAYPFEENIRRTKEVVDKFHPMCIPIEAELGHVGAETNYEEALAHYMYTPTPLRLRSISRFWSRYEPAYPSLWCCMAPPGSETTTSATPSAWASPRSTSTPSCVRRPWTPSAAVRRTRNIRA